MCRTASRLETDAAASVSRARLLRRLSFSARASGRPAAQAISDSCRIIAPRSRGYGG
ncbi:hypothetical protein [Cryobacterium flavum]|uniref:hypothetical protein n=1 Tax=Cryobacterium flavum TaxID=1424659 RepID=UPI0013566796|nr:hypothetical protein [Cryobacterium flavum]